jgi:methylmalonyl-CoA mutase C-terminal domain/subunit
MHTKRGIKVIVSMIGLDGHTTGAEVVARMLRDAGFEVVYLGPNQTPEMIAAAALQEDVDAVGISSHASNYGQIVALIGLLRGKGLADVPVICGGNIPKHHARQLRDQGVAEIFPPGSSSQAIIDFLVGAARKSRGGLALAAAGA